MSKVGIEIFMTGQTTVNRSEVERWLKFIGVSDDYALPGTDVITDPALLVALAAKRCYKAFEVALNPNLQRVRNNWAEYLENILASGHGSVLEHAVYTFAIENVSRVFTGEMNRHRAGWAISEGSMRFIRFGEDIPYWEPTSIQGPQVFGDDTADTFVNDMLGDRELHDVTFDLDGKKELTRAVFRAVFGLQRDYYAVMERIWADELAPKSKFKAKKEITSMMRRIVGMGCATGGTWTGNIRALRHVLTTRTAPGAEEEILYVYSRVAMMIKEREPMLFGDFTQDPESGCWYPKYVKV